MSSTAQQSQIQPPVTELVVRDLDSSTTIFSVPFQRGPIPFGGRSTAITLQSGDVWVVASTPLDQVTADKLTSKGPVKYIIAPDAEHTMYTGQYLQAFPDAKVYIPNRTAEQWAKDDAKKPFISRIAHTFGKGLGDPFATATNGEIQTADWGAAHANEDVAFFHAPTKTLIEADLLFNLPPTEQYSKSSSSGSALFITGALQPGTFWHKQMVARMLNKDTKVFKEQAQRVAAWDFNRLIPCHGDVIEGPAAKKAWLDTFASLLN